MKTVTTSKNRQSKVMQEGNKTRPELGREMGIDFPRVRQLEEKSNKKTEETES